MASRTGESYFATIGSSTPTVAEYSVMAPSWGLVRYVPRAHVQVIFPLSFLQTAVASRLSSFVCLAHLKFV